MSFFSGGKKAKRKVHRPAWKVIAEMEKASHRATLQKYLALTELVLFYERVHPELRKQWEIVQFLDDGPVLTAITDPEKPVDNPADRPLPFEPPGNVSTGDATKQGDRP